MVSCVVIVIGMVSIGYISLPISFSKKWFVVHTALPFFFARSFFVRSNWRITKYKCPRYVIYCLQIVNNLNKPMLPL